MNQNNQIVGYDPQTGQPIYKTIKRGGMKNFLIYELFNFIFSIIVPLVLLFLNMAIMTSEKASVVETIILLVQAIALLLFKDVIVCKLAKSAAKSTYLMGKFVFVLNLLDILLATIILFNNDFALNVAFIIYAVFIIGKMVSYVLVKLLVLKEKIEYKKYLIIGALSYIALITFLYYATNPTGLNKLLFNMFGTTEFSSKEVKIEIVERYNENEYRDDVNYTHKFTAEELEQIKELNTSYNITVDDLALLPNILSLELNNCSYENLDFSKNNSLVIVKIKNSKIKTLDTSNLKHVSRIEISDSEIDNLIINEGKIESVYIEKSKFKEFKVSGSSIEEVEAPNSTINYLEVINTSNLKVLKFNDSSIETVLLDNNVSLENTDYTNRGSVKIDKINNLEIKNVKSLDNLLENSYFTFKNIKFLDDKGFKLENGNYLQLQSASLYVPENTKVKELILENMTAVVIDRYHELISCDDSGLCSYEEEQKTKIQGPDSTLGDMIELYDKANNKLFNWLVLDYKEGEL